MIAKAGDNMQKVMIIGCPGAGKSTFARELREKTGLPLFYLDMIWHKEDRTETGQEEFDLKLDEILRSDKWIIDGNYRRTLEPRLRACDTVFFLDFPFEVCISGVRQRMGKPREDMPWIEDSEDEEFMEFIKTFKKNESPRIYDLLADYDNKNIIIFRTREEIKEYLQGL